MKYYIYSLKKPINGATFFVSDRELTKKESYNFKKKIMEIEDSDLIIGEYTPKDLYKEISRILEEKTKQEFGDLVSFKESLEEVIVSNKQQVF